MGNQRSSLFICMHNCSFCACKYRVLHVQKICKYFYLHPHFSLDLLIGMFSAYFQSSCLSWFVAHLRDSRLYQYNYENITLYSHWMVLCSHDWKSKVLARIIHYEDPGLLHCLTGKPSGICSTEHSIVRYPENSLLRVKSQSTCHFTNIPPTLFLEIPLLSLY